MKSMKKMLIVMFLFVSFFTLQATVEASGATEIKVHYYRFDENYTNWNFWMWRYLPTSGNGRGFYLNDTTSLPGWGAVSIDLTDSANAAYATADVIGYIPRLGGGTSDWGSPTNRDGDQDFYFDMSQAIITAGVLNLYVIQGDVVPYYTSEAAQAAAVHKVNSAFFTSSNQIRFETTKVGLTSANVSILQDGNQISYSNFSVTDQTGTLQLGAAADLTKSYVLRVDFNDGNPVSEYDITFDGIYDSPIFEDAFAYDGELGVIFENGKTTFKLWAPISSAITLNVYDKGHSTRHREDGQNNPTSTHELTLGAKGVWSLTLDQDLNGKYYTYSVTNGTRTFEVTDPYAKSAGVNAERGMIIDPSRYNPAGWNSMQLPHFSGNAVDAILYELHVRDLTSHSSWNGPANYRGKFMGLTVTGTTHEGVKTGLDHLVELGITHLHLLPAFDFGYVDETRLEEPGFFNVHDGGFNWGYMPELFNAPEGSYSTNPFDGSTRVAEFKEMVKALADNGILTVMDVVYNHTARTGDMNFNRILPGYYFRTNPNGSFSNGSGTGNETASERYMFRKFMIDSVSYWAEEYNVRGFRFDLMALHDWETMNQLTDALHAIDPSIIVYGEPWTGGGTPLAAFDQATKGTMNNMPNVGAFNDVSRNAIRGSNNGGGRGWVSGNRTATNRDGVMFGLVGGNTTHPQVFHNGGGFNYVNPNQVINYVSAHDNNTLHDQLALSVSGLAANRRLMAMQAHGIVLTSQGVPFLHAGDDFLRTKPCVVPATGDKTCDANNRFDHNSYRSPDQVNQIDWNLKVTNLEVFNFHKDLIALRKAHPAFRLTTFEDINAKMTFIDIHQNVIAYILESEDDTWPTIMVVHSSHNIFINTEQLTVPFVLPEGNQANSTDPEMNKWTIRVSNQESLVEEYNVGDPLYLEPFQTVVLSYGFNANAVPSEPTTPSEGVSPLVLTVIIIGSAGVVGAGGFVAFKFIKKPK